MFYMGIADLVNALTHDIYAVCTISRLKHTLPPMFVSNKEAIDKCLFLQCQ